MRHDERFECIVKHLKSDSNKSNLDMQDFRKWSDGCMSTELALNNFVCRYSIPVEEHIDIDLFAEWIRTMGWGKRNGI